MIYIFPYSWLSIITFFLIKKYFRSIGKNISIKLGRKPYISYPPTTYFIIKSMFLSEKKLQEYLKYIRQRTNKGHIIIIGKNIDYDSLFKNHLRAFGVIDTSETVSVSFLRSEIYFYLNGIYPADNIVDS